MTNTNTGAVLPHATCILIYTDGSCQPNPGRGGYAAIMCRYIDGALVNRLDRTGKSTMTTNNQMELQAAISALKVIKRDEPQPIYIRSDSKYLIDGWNQWLPGWIAKGWRKGDGKRVENQDLWQEIARLCEGLNVTFEWIRGHAGDCMNEEADRLAADAREGKKPKVAFAKVGEAA